MLFGAWSILSHYLNRCWHYANWTFGFIHVFKFAETVAGLFPRLCVLCIHKWIHKNEYYKWMKTVVEFLEKRSTTYEIKTYPLLINILSYYYFDTTGRWLLYQPYFPAATICFDTVSHSMCPCQGSTKQYFTPSDITDGTLLKVTFLSIFYERNVYCWFQFP